MIKSASRKSPYPTARITDLPTGLAVVWGSVPHERLIPLNPTHAERTLVNLMLHMRAKINPQRVFDHLSYHQSDADSGCPCCKLEGRIISALSRKADTQIRRATSGSVQVRRVPAGLSGAQILDLERKASLRSKSKHEASLPTPVAFTKHNIEDLI